MIEKEQQPSNNVSFFIHLFLFFILYLFFYISFTNTYKIIIFCLTYGVVIEILQLFTSRGFQTGDIIFNLLGVMIGFIYLNLFYKKKYNNF